MESEQFLWKNEHYQMLDYRHQRHHSEDLYLLMCGLEQCVPGKSYGPKQRPGYHLHVILSGEGVFETGGQRTSLHAGQFFLEKPGELTWYAASGEKPWVYCWVTFDGVQAAYYMEQAGFVRDIHTLNCFVAPEQFYQLAKALLERPQLNLANELRRQGLLTEFIGLAVESALLSSRGRHSADNSPDAYVDCALDFIHHHFDHIRVADISNFVGVNRSYFCNIFRKRVGVSPQAYLLRVRMRRGSELLLSTRASVKEIARSVGYEHALTFSSVFKSFYGVSPMHYRAQPDGERVYLPEIPLPWRDDQ